MATRPTPPGFPLVERPDLGEHQGMGHTRGITPEDLVLGTSVRPEDMPAVAGDWLAAGHDSPALRVLAGSIADDPLEVIDLFLAAMHELGYPKRDLSDDEVYEAFPRTVGGREVEPGVIEVEEAGPGGATYTILASEADIIRRAYAEEDIVDDRVIGRPPPPSRHPRSAGISMMTLRLEETLDSIARDRSRPLVIDWRRRR